MQPNKQTSLKNSFPSERLLACRDYLGTVSKNVSDDSPKNYSIPDHYVVVCRCTADTSWRVFLQSVHKFLILTVTA